MSPEGLLLPERCPKCASYQGWGVTHCGPHSRVSACPTPHTLGDGEEHLVIDCRRCSWVFTVPCADFKAPVPPDLSADWKRANQ